MYDAQESWFERARSGKSGPVLDVEDYPDIPTLRAAWERLDADMDAYLAGLDEAALLEKVSPTGRSMAARGPMPART